MRNTIGTAWMVQDIETNEQFNPPVSGRQRQGFHAGFRLNQLDGLPRIRSSLPGSARCRA